MLLAALCASQLILVQSDLPRSPWAEIGSYRPSSRQAEIDEIYPGIAARINLSFLGDSARYADIAVDPDLRTAVVGSGSELFEVDLASEGKKRTIGLEQGSINDVVLLSGDLFLVRHGAGHDSLWSRSRNEPLRRFGSSSDGWATSVYASPMGKSIASATNGKVTVLSLPSLAIVTSFQAPPGQVVAGVELSEDGKTASVRTVGDRAMQYFYLYHNKLLKRVGSAFSVSETMTRIDTATPYMSLDERYVREPDSNQSASFAGVLPKGPGSLDFTDLAFCRYAALFGSSESSIISELRRTRMTRRIVAPLGSYGKAIFNGDAVETLKFDAKPVIGVVKLASSSSPTFQRAGAGTALTLSGGHRFDVTGSFLDSRQRIVFTVSSDSLALWSEAGKLLKRISAVDAGVKEFPRTILGYDMSGKRIVLKTSYMTPSATIVMVDIAQGKARLIERYVPNEFGDQMPDDNSSDVAAGDGKYVDFFVSDLPYRVEESSSKAYVTRANAVPERASQSVTRRFASFDLGRPAFLVPSTDNVVAIMMQRENDLHLVVLRASTLEPLLVTAQSSPSGSVTFDDATNEVLVDSGGFVQRWRIRKQ